MSLLPVISGAMLALMAAAAGAGILVGGIFLGAYLTRATKNSKDSRLKRRKKRRQVAAPPPLPVNEPVAVAVAVDSPPAQAAPPAPELPQSPPAPNSLTERIIKLHARAVRHWHRGEQEVALDLMIKAVDLNQQHQNVWLDEELLGQYATILAGLYQFDRASAVREYVRNVRRVLGQAPKSSYLPEKIDDLTWMIEQHEHDLERSQEAFALSRETSLAMEAGDRERAMELAKQAVASALKSAGPNHWITAVMFNNVAQVFMEGRDIEGAQEYWKKAQTALSDWPHMLPPLAHAINHNLRMCEGGNEGEEWKG